MSQSEKSEAPGTAEAGVFSRLRAWWRRRTELDTMAPQEIARIAGDVGVAPSDLKDLVARGPHAADLLHERMRALGLSREHVQDVAYTLMRDLERTCTYCNKKRVCERDLAERPSDPVWESYCPNAFGLTYAKAAKGHFPA